MLDLRLVVANLDEVKRRLATRGEGATAALAPIEALAAERRQLIQSSETERAEQRKASEQMRTLKGEEQAQLRARLKTLSDEVKAKEARLKEVEEKIEQALLNVPNLPHESVPVGSEAADNEVVRDWGEKPVMSFAPKEHYELGEALGVRPCRLRAPCVRPAPSRGSTRFGPLIAVARREVRAVHAAHPAGSNSNSSSRPVIAKTIWTRSAPGTNRKA